MLGFYQRPQAEKDDCYDISMGKVVCTSSAHRDAASGGPMARRRVQEQAKVLPAGGRILRPWVERKGQVERLRLPALEPVPIVLEREYLLALNTFGIGS